MAEKTPYERLLAAIAAEPERPAVAVHWDQNGLSVTEHPPLSYDESEYGARMRLIAEGLGAVLESVFAERPPLPEQKP